MPAKATTPAISDAEWDVMKVVWDHGPLTSGEVVKRLEAEKDWKPRTIKTLLARLVQKGAVEAKETDGKHLYAAKVSREALAKREGRSFLARVFDGAVAPALVHFIQDAQLSPQQIAELKKILDREARNDRADRTPDRHR
jgi:BlaI family transcriptional regulator, penicillinase repressor